MGGKPKKPKPSESEKATAEIGALQSQKHRDVYDPLARADMKDALSDDIRQIMRGRTSADVAQAKKQNASYANVIKPTANIEKTMAATKGAKTKADAAAAKIQNKRLAGGVSNANKLGAASQSALADLARIETKEATNKMERDAAENAAAWAAGSQLAGSAYMKYGNRDGKLMKAVQYATETDDKTLDWLRG